jgi:hypothetical protein
VEFPSRWNFFTLPKDYKAHLIDQLDILVAHRNYSMTDLMEMPLYWRHKVLYNFMEEKRKEKQAYDEAKARSNSK